MGPDPDSTPDGDDGIDRRRLIMYVLAIAIAIPVIVEGVTLLGLVGNYVGGSTPTAADTPTGGGTTVEGVLEGDELLSATAREERITTARLRSGDGWTFTISVRVDNTGEVPYEVRLGAVSTDAGTSVSGRATTGAIAPNATGSVTAQYTLPSGERPQTIRVRAIEHGADGTTVVVNRTVRIGPIPVEG